MNLAEPRPKSLRKTANDCEDVAQPSRSTRDDTGHQSPLEDVHPRGNKGFCWGDQDRVNKSDSGHQKAQTAGHRSPKKTNNRSPCKENQFGSGQRQKSRGPKNFNPMKFFNAMSEMMEMFSKQK